MKIRKTYRLQEGTVDQIQAIKEFFASEGFGYSDANIIERAVSSYMDNVGEIRKLYKYKKEQNNDTDTRTDNHN